MKKLISATLAATLALSLAACGSTASTTETASSEAASTESTAASSEAAESTSDLAGTTLKVAASPTPHAEILNVAKEILAEQGIDLEVVEFSDYVQPNLVTENGEVDANYFQHTPYLDSFNEENGTHLVSVGAVHYEPFGIYPGKSSDLANIADGATIAVPNDTTNEARALQLLAAQGLITVRDGAGLTATVNDITENPHNVKIQEIEAAQLPRTVQDVDFAVINGNYAIEAGFSVGKDALATDPKVLLCDEATSALDPNTTHAILQLIQKINRELGITVVIITHQMSVVEEVCNRVAILDNGTVVEEGSVQAIFSHPTSKAARRLVYPAGAPKAEALPGQRLVRVAFGGTQTTDKPLVASLAIECGALVSIMAADTRIVNGQTLGSMLLALPDDDKAEAAIEYIKNYPGITYEEVNG